MKRTKNNTPFTYWTMSNKNGTFSAIIGHKITAFNYQYHLDGQTEFTDLEELEKLVKEHIEFINNHDEG